MRYCPYCHHWNVGRLQLCNYCGRSWHVRLCPRGHANPYDAQYCGVCGSADLTDTAGPRPLWIWLVRVGVVLVFVALLVLLGRGRPHLTEPIISYMVAIGLLIAGLSLVLSILPNPVRRLLLTINRIAKKMLKRALSWFRDKLKQLFE